MSAPADAAVQVGRVALAGRREAALLDDPSVARAVGLLAGRMRAPVPWVRALVGTLDRFRAIVLPGPAQPHTLAQAVAAWRADPAGAARALASYAGHWPAGTDTQLSSLGFGPKVWLAAGGVVLPWRSLGGAPSSTRRAARGLAPRAGEEPERLLMLAMLGSGLSAAEVLALRVNDAGMLDSRGTIVPDLDADPLAVGFAPEEAGPRRVTFLAYDAAQLARSLHAAGTGPGDALVPVPPGTDLVARAAGRHGALIGAGNEVNVALCRATGDFFRSWGMPGARFRRSS